MQIEYLRAPESMTTGIGLSPIEMTKLKDIVILAGRNGSGKTRLLKLLSNIFKDVPNEFIIRMAEAKIISSKKIIETNNKAIKEHEEDTSTSRMNQSLHEDIIWDLQNGIKEAEIDIKKAEEVLKFSNYIKFDKLKKSQDKIIAFVPKSLTLRDSYLMTANEMTQSSEAIFDCGIENIEDYSLAFIQTILSKWHNARRRKDDGEISDAEMKSATDGYEKMQKYIATFLGTKIGSDEGGNATIFGKRLGQAELSDGQKVLIQFCMAFYVQDGRLGKSIIIMDEPENHLHPAALMEVLDSIYRNIGEGQLWIATHSIHILAHFDNNNIWYVENGKVSYAGSIPRKVLKGLLGNEDEIARLTDYLSLPAKMASENFAYQCLFNPEVIFTDADDPQTSQIHQIISSRVAEGKKIKVLDIGVGKGRLLSSISENERLNGRNVVEWLDYYAYDADPTYSEVCKKQLEKVYGQETRYFNRLKDVHSALSEGVFDFVIMCNVLHEIDPKKWVDFFSGELSLMTLLKSDGNLLIVEDQFLAVGEKAHSKGFLVLDTLELIKLFEANGDANITSFDYRNDGRLKAHFVPAKITRNVNSSSRVMALKKLQANAQEEVMRIRGQKPTYRNGRLHSFWAQQFANASLSLLELQ